MLVSSTCSYNGLANSRFQRLVFGFNQLRSGEMPYFGPKHDRLRAFVQLLCNLFSTKIADPFNQQFAC